MTTTKEYRTELRSAMKGMDGAEKLRAIIALREFVPLAEVPPSGVPTVLGTMRRYVFQTPTIVAITRLMEFLERMLPLHLEADSADEVEATLGAVEDLLQEDHDRRKAARGDTP